MVCDARASSGARAGRVIFCRHEARNSRLPPLPGKRSPARASLAMTGEGTGETLLAERATAGGLTKGSNLNDTYEILGLLFEGGMGDIYEARHLRLTGRYAVKVLRQEITANNPSLFDRFRREAEVTSSLRHPHIVQVVDFNRTPNGSAYFVMELLEGVNLRQHLEEHGPMAVADVAIIVEQVASALEAAHERGIVHRDLKPENIQLVPVPGRKEPFVKVLDFGISKVLTASTLTQESMLVGTPFYMAPEQARGGSDDLDGRTDEFALGAIAHELLTGQRIFFAETVAAIIYRVIHDEPESLAPRAGAAVDGVVRKALAKNPEDRYRRVTEFAEALRDAVFGPARTSLSTVPLSHTTQGTASVNVSATSRPTVADAGAGVAQAATTSLQPAPSSATRRWLGLAAGLAVAIAVAVGIGKNVETGPEPVWMPAEGEPAIIGARLATQVRRLVDEETNHLADTAGRAAQVPPVANALIGRVDEATFQDLLANEVWWADFRAFGVAVLIDDEVKVTWHLPATAGAPQALVKAVSAGIEAPGRAALIPGTGGGPILAAVAPIQGVKGGRLLLVSPLNRAFLTELGTRANAVLLLSDGRRVLDVSVPENTLPELNLLVGHEANAVQLDKRHRRLAAVTAWSPTLWIWAVTGWTS